MRDKLYFAYLFINLLWFIISLGVKQAQIKVKLPEGIIPPSCVVNESSGEISSGISDTDEVEVHFSWKKNFFFRKYLIFFLQIFYNFFWKYFTTFFCSAVGTILFGILFFGNYDSIFDNALASDFNVPTLPGVPRCPGTLQTYQRDQKVRKYFLTTSFIKFLSLGTIRVFF